LPENPEVNKCLPPKLQNYILLLSILHTTRYYEDESKVTHTQCQIGLQKKTHTSMDEKNTNDKTNVNNNRIM